MYNLLWICLIRGGGMEINPYTDFSGFHVRPGESSDWDFRSELNRVRVLFVFFHLVVHTVCLGPWHSFWPVPFSSVPWNVTERCVSAWTGMLDQVASRGPFWPQLICDSVNGLENCAIESLFLQVVFTRACCFFMSLFIYKWMTLKVREWQWLQTYTAYL